MNTTIEEGKQLVKDIDALAKTLSSDVELVVSPPYTHLCPISGVISALNSRIALAAQNCANRKSGAYTGEVSAKMLSAIPCKYVIIGHSERREYYGETNATLLEKIRLVLEEGMKPIYCVGEKLEEREANIHFEVVSTQICEVIYELQEAEALNVVIAYEPVWAIGTGKTATADQAEEMHAHIRDVIGGKYPMVASAISILYGGSMKLSNAAELLSKESVDGGLIGGASLIASEFAGIASSFKDIE